MGEGGGVGGGAAYLSDAPWLGWLPPSDVALRRDDTATYTARAQGAGAVERGGHTTV